MAPHLIGIVIGLGLWAVCMAVGPAVLDAAVSAALVALALVATDIFVLTRPALAEPGAEAERELRGLDESWGERSRLRTGSRALAVGSLQLALLSSGCWALAYGAASLGLDELLWFILLLFAAIVATAGSMTVLSARRLHSLRGLGDPRRGLRGRHFGRTSDG